MELPFVFGSQTTVTVENPPVKAEFSDDEKRLSQRMVDYWTHFATTGTPNSTRTPDWPRYRAGSRRVQVLNDPISRGRTTAANCSFWDTLGYDLPGLYDRLHEKTKK
jgi:carboxylesterase type B